MFAVLFLYYRNLQKSTVASGIMLVCFSLIGILLILTAAFVTSLLIPFVFILFIVICVVTGSLQIHAVRKERPKLLQIASIGLV